MTAGRHKPYRDAGEVIVVRGHLRSGLNRTSTEPITLEEYRRQQTVLEPQGCPCCGTTVVGGPASDAPLARGKWCYDCAVFMCWESTECMVANRPAPETEEKTDQ